MPRSFKGNGTLGRSLIKNVRKKQYVPHQQISDEAKFIHRDNNEAIIQKQQIRDLSSLIDQDNLNEYLQTAQLAEKNFDAERGIKIAKDDQGREIIYDPNLGKKDIYSYDVQKNILLSKLRIPRKPSWDKTTSTQELHRRENNAFLDWRRNLAKVEQDHYEMHITPYEKNPEVWKQLWRVVERSDILVQIVDGRDPLFFRCEDLESYVKEVDQHKMNFLLVNKSDLLSEDVRKTWNKFFLENGIDHMFFSAKMEQEKINNEPEETGIKNSVLFDLEKEQKKKQTQKNYVNCYEIANRESLIYSLQQLVEKQKKIKKSKKNHITQIKEVKEEKEEEEEEKEGEQKNSTKAKKLTQQQQEEEKQLQDVLDDLEKNLEIDSDNDEQNIQNNAILDNVDDEEFFDNEQEKEETNEEYNKRRQEQVITIGMVGYPNVGKSSVINALCNKKLVGVGNMPGKTRNFQTVFIEEDVLLCDCPGLVFPNAGSTRQEMVCNGVLPIDRLIDYLSPIDLLAERIPVVVFEALYSLEIGVDKINGYHLLSVYAKRKGYLREGAEPDQARSAKLILKNFINGVLIYCKLPPTHDEEKDGKIWQSNDLNKLKNKKEKDQLYQQTLEQDTYSKQQSELEQQVFKEELDNNTQIYFDDNDLVDLMDGKRVHNIKLTKQQKRDIKYAFNRGEPIDFKSMLQKEQVSQYTFKVKNKQMLKK